MSANEFEVLVEASARHLHLSAADLAVLFGEGFELHKKRDLSQPGEFLTDEKVTITGSRNKIDKVSVLGPVRKATQIEISLTDARTLGVEPPVRLSGDLAGSPGIKVTGPAGEIELTEGVIIAKRHMHVVTSDAQKYGLTDRQVVCVQISGERAVTFDECVVRVSDNFATAVHIDYDEANAAGVSGTVTGIVKY